MRYLSMRDVRVAILVVFSFLFVSCAEQDPPQQQSEEQSSVVKVEGLKEKATLRARIIDAWSSPEMVGTATVNSTATAFLHGPLIETNVFGTSFLRWRVHTDLNPITGQYQNGTTTVMKRDPNGQWQFSSPVPFNLQSRSTLPDIAFNNQDGTAQAAWADSGIIYNSRYSPLTGWSPPSQIGTGNQVWLVSNDQGQVAAVWVRSSTNAQFFIGAKKYISGVWSSEFQIARDSTFVSSSEPVIDNLGQVLFVWQDEHNGQRGIHSSSLAASGWSAPTNVRAPQPIGTELVIGLQLAIADQTGQAQLVIQVADSITGDGLFAFSYQQGFWSNGENIDGNIFSQDRTQLEPFGFASNSQGQMVAAWVEEQTDNVNNYSIIYANRYLPGQGWGTPQPVSPPVFRGAVGAPPTTIVPTYLNSIDAVIDDQGEATIAWVENSQGLSELFSAHYMSGVWNTPELIVSYIGQDIVVEEPDLTMATTVPAIAWRQSKRTPQGVVYDIWSARKLGQNGGVVTPSPLQPGATKPANHIASSNNCSACHAATGVVVVNHNEVIGLCNDCHNGLTASGKPSNHLLTSNRCDACHTSSAWLPAIAVDHRDVLGTCVSCHNGIQARGKGPNHIPSSDQCEQCHNSLSWLTASTNPPGSSTTPITSNTPKPLNHIASTDNCFSCHIGGSRTVSVVDHAQVIGTCMNCHNGVVASGKSLAHFQTTDRCEACHATGSWVPAISVDHTQVLGSCATCHNNVYATGKSANHIVSSNQCEQCHSVTAWVPATGGNPVNSGPTGTWSAPAAVWSNTSTSSSNDYVHGPKLEAAPSNMFVSMVKHSQFNGLTGRYELGENFVYYSSDGNGWQQVLPAPRAEMLNATMVRIKVAPDGSRAYALWSKLGELFFSESTGQGQWTPPQMIGNVDGQYHLLLNNQTVTAVWRSTEGPNRVVLNARVYRSGFPWGDVRRLEVSETAQFAEPVVDTQGRVYIARQELLNNSSGGLTLLMYLNNFTSASGWSSDTPLPALPIDVFSPVSLIVSLAGQQQVYVVAGVNGVVGFSDSGLFALSPASQFGWQNLINAPNNLVGKPTIVSNELGQAMIAWVQSQGQNVSGPRYNIYASSSTGAGLWDAPARIGVLNDNFESDPRLVMYPSGEVSAFWVSESFTQSVLYTNHYTPFAGWGVAPQSIVVNDINVNGLTSTPDAVYTSAGDLLVTWKQTLKEQFNTQYSVWASRSLLQQ